MARYDRVCILSRISSFSLFDCTMQEGMTTVEVCIDHNVHSRLIGARGRAINKIMDDYKVDIRMPGRDAEDPDLVIISGHEDDVADCQEHLLNLEEEYVRHLCFLVLLILLIGCQELP